MIVAVCVDEKNGMTFCGKRLSRDKKLIKNYMILCGGKTRISPFSMILFEGRDVIIDSGLLENAGDGEYCFIENKDIIPFADKIEKLIIYKWNRRYPSDRKFVMPKGFRFCGESDFEGSSHENISREIYVREEKLNEQ